MALVAADLATAIASAMNARMIATFPHAATGIASYHGEMATAIASAVVTYLTANAAVVPGTMVAGGDPVTGSGGVT